MQMRTLDLITTGMPLVWFACFGIAELATARGACDIHLANFGHALVESLAARRLGPLHLSLSSCAPNELQSCNLGGMSGLGLGCVKTFWARERSPARCISIMTKHGQFD